MMLLEMPNINIFYVGEKKLIEMKIYYKYMKSLDMKMVHG